MPAERRKEKYEEEFLGGIADLKSITTIVSPIMRKIFAFSLFTDVYTKF